MNDRAAEEFALLRRRWADLVHEPSGDWILIPVYPLPDGWNNDRVGVAFQLPALLPGQAPYGFYARDPLSYRGQHPSNYTFPAQAGTVPFAGDWGQFSWTPDPWQPGSRPHDGSNMVQFAASFARRFEEGT